MSVTKIYGQISFVCDSCGESEEVDDAPFEQSWSALAAAGWRTKKIGREWKHWCPDCDPVP